MIALPLAAHYRTVQLVRRAGQLLVDIKVVPDVLQYYVMRAGIEDLDGLPLINLTQIPLQGWNQIVKRAFDIIGSALLLAGNLLAVPPHRLADQTRGRRKPVLLFPGAHRIGWKVFSPL